MAKRHRLLLKFGKWVFRDFEKMSSEKKKRKKAERFETETCLFDVPLFI